MAEKVPELPLLMHEVLDRARNGKLEFYHCKRCGCVLHHERSTKRADATDTRAVNMRNVDDPSIVADLPIKLLDGSSSWRVLEETKQPYLLQSPKPVP